MIFFLFLAALPMQSDAQGCSGGDNSTCGRQSCCPIAGQGPGCYWLEIWIPHNRKRSESQSRDNQEILITNDSDTNTVRPLVGLALELSQLYHLGDEANFTRFLDGNVPVLPHHAHIRDRLYVTSL
jgi:hypothetical protein